MSKSYSIGEVAEEGVLGLNTAIDKEDMGISVRTGLRVNAPRRALHPAP
jgi:hypothetical protein